MGAPPSCMPPICGICERAAAVGTRERALGLTFGDAQL